jgi:hypothetical protein
MTRTAPFSIRHYLQQGSELTSPVNGRPNESKNKQAGKKAEKLN